MRVLHVIPAVASRYGGPSAAIAPMCRALGARGIEASIVTTDADGPNRLDVSLAQWTEWHGVRAMFFRKTFSESFKYSPTLAAWLMDHVQNADVVHIHGVLSHPCFAAGSACRRHRVPYIVRPLGTLAPWSLRQKALRKRLLLTCGGMRLLRGAAAIHYTSEREQHDVEAALGLPRGVVIPLGIDESLLKVTAQEGRREPHVVAISRIHPKKNLELLITGFLDAARTSDEWKLIIAGTGDPDYLSALETLVRERKAGGRVKFVGWLDEDARRELLDRASLFALCSKHENFGLSALEAMAAGVPVLLSPDVDLAAAVERARAGWIVKADAGEIARALTSVMNNLAERASRAEAARFLAQTFTWSSVASQLVTTYGSATPNRRASQQRDGLLSMTS